MSNGKRPSQASVSKNSSSNLNVDLAQTKPVIHDQHKYDLNSNLQYVTTEAKSRIGY